MTIIAANNQKDSPEATFPLVIGNKNNDHNRVEWIIMEDFRHMATTRSLAFIGGTNG
jgi:3-methyladenine DNA glycosylase AlkC